MALYMNCVLVLILALVYQVAAEAKANKACSLKPDPGPCKAFIIRWYYNPISDKCESFIWGGCLGVVPFETKQECSVCVRDRCDLVPDPGLCEALIPRYFWNPESGMCESFDWGGCDGVVPYTTLEQCKAASCHVDRCRLTPLKGPCRGFFPRFYFNQKTGKCDKFIWGGCLGRVPFPTLAICQKAKCKANKCKLTPDPGPCRGSFPKYFWNDTTRKCEQFTYGGCLGRVPFNDISECTNAKCDW